MDKSNSTQTTDKAVKGGFGSQVNSKGRPQTIAHIKHIPVSFEEFIRDEEPLIIRNYDGNDGIKIPKL
jgi:hypothetical protein